MDISLVGKKALVCGSSQGIGKASAIELAKLGASVTLLARNEASLKEVVAELDSSQSQTHTYLVADFSDNVAVKQKIAAHKEFHILVNNTGGPPGGLAVKADLDEFTTAFNNHLLNSHILVLALTPFMKTEAYGRVINIISTSVKIPIKGLGVSNTIRGAVANWSTPPRR